jgi:hypothetical protein
MGRIPLDLVWEIEAPDGVRHRWDANQPAGSRLRNARFGSKLGEGFSDGGGSLARRIDLDYPDLNLGQRVTATGADGTIAYEGYVAAMPRDLSDTHSIGVTFTGWMAHAKHRKFSEIYVDRSLDWGPASRARKALMLSGNQNPVDPEQTSDPTDSTAGITTHVDGAWASPYVPVAEAWWDAGPGNLIGKIAYQWKRQGTTINTADAWTWLVAVSDDDKLTTTLNTGNLKAAGPSALSLFEPATAYRYGRLLLFLSTTPAGADGARYAVDWYKLAVYGNHGLTLHTGEPSEPAGVYGSDVIRDIVGRFCPELDASGVEDSDYVIQHLSFRDRVFPYDAFLEINKYHLRHLGVWENRRLDWRPYDLSDYDWEIRTDDPGTTFSPAGPTTSDLFNGIVVAYTNVLTGIRHVLTPDDHDELTDTSTSNPWNQLGIEVWDEIELSSPTVHEQALQLGRAALAEKNRPKTPGTITVRGYIRDRAGIEQPAWKPRAGEVICITNFNEINRLIAEADYDDETKTLQIAVDFPFQTLEALFDRQATAAGARGLA